MLLASFISEGLHLFLGLDDNLDRIVLFRMYDHTEAQTSLRQAEPVSNHLFHAQGARAYQFQRHRMVCRAPGIRGCQRYIVAPENVIY